MPKLEYIALILTSSLIISLNVLGQYPFRNWQNRIKGDSTITDLLGSKLLITSKEFSLFQIDTGVYNKIIQSFQPINTDSIISKFSNQFKRLPSKQKQFFQLRNGHINYNWSYRSNIDTPFLENNVSQHFINSSLNVIVAQSIPIRVSYFGRSSNSAMFRDYNDFRVEFDAFEYQKMQRLKISPLMENKIAEIRNPFISPAIAVNNNKILALDEWLRSPVVVSKLLQAKRSLKDSIFLDSLQFDSLNTQKQLVAFYQKVKDQKESLIKQRDSLINIYLAAEKKIKSLQKIANGNASTLVNEELTNLPVDSILSRNELKKLTNVSNPIKTLSIGKSIPIYSDLSIKNVSIKGFNFEYNHNNFYYAFIAGSLDYRSRDFLNTKQKRLPQYLYSVRLGYGSREKNNIIFTYYSGKKQLFGSSASNTVTKIFGITLSTQLFVGSNTRINAEIAQSAAPNVIINNDKDSKPQLNIHDRQSGAWHVQFRTYIPKTKTKLEGFYQNAGAAFQSFNSYKVNASVDRWSIKADQTIWDQQIHLIANVQKNTFDNPFIQQRYSSNTVFKSLSATFHRRNWPSATIAYLPSSQYTVLDSQIFESRYHLFNTVLQHQYKIGEASAVSSLVYSKFFNEHSDSGFIFYNTHNYNFNQLFNFSQFSTSLAIAHSFNHEYSLDVFDLAVNAAVYRQQQIGVGVKVSHLDTYDTKVGFYTNVNYTIKKLGAISIRLEKCYLPGIYQKLIKSDFYNVGFTRFIF